MEEEVPMNNNEETERRQMRKRYKETIEDIQDNKKQMRDPNSNVFNTFYEKFREVSANAEKTRELQYDSTIVKELSLAVKAQAAALCDMSTRFSWQDLMNNIKNKFSNSDHTLNWEKLGMESRMIFNTVPSFDTMVGPIHKQEKFRKVSVRRQRDNSNITAVTGQIIENHEEDENDEATNARVKKLMDHLESFEGGQYDLLRTLIDPSNPVQSVENFFDYSYLHKVCFRLLLYVLFSSNSIVVSAVVIIVIIVVVVVLVCIVV